MKHATFTGMVKTVASDTDPLQQHIRFIFTDNQANKNKQGVPAEEFDNIVRTAVMKPVKANFRGAKIQGHPGAIPVGPILSAEIEGDHVIANAIIWRDEYKELAEYLDKASAESNGAHFSWELYYADSEVKNGIEWLKGIIVAAATLVSNPAYGGRTPLLAVAEEQFMEELEKKLEKLTEQVTNMNASLAEKDKQIAELQAKLATAEKAVIDADAEKQTLTSEVAELKKFRVEREAEDAKKETLMKRKDALAQAGIDMTKEQFESRSALFLSMSDETFDAYVKDVSTASKAKSSASTNDRVFIPDPVSGGGQVPSKTELAKALRQLRGN